MRSTWTTDELKYSQHLYLSNEDRSTQKLENKAPKLEKEALKDENEAAKVRNEAPWTEWT